MTMNDYSYPIPDHERNYWREKLRLLKSEVAHIERMLTSDTGARDVVRRGDPASTGATFGGAMFIRHDEVVMR